MARAKVIRELNLLEEGGEFMIGKGAVWQNFTGLRIGLQEIEPNGTRALMAGYDFDLEAGDKREKAQWYVGEDGHLYTRETTDLYLDVNSFIVNAKKEISLRVTTEDFESQIQILEGEISLKVSSATFESEIEILEDEISLKVSSGDVASELTIELDGITMDTGIVKSDNWNGTVDGSYNITAPGTAGWALTKAGDAAYANKLYGKDVELTGTIQTGDGTRYARLTDGGGSIGGVLELVGPGIGTVNIQVDDAVHSLDFLGAVTYYFDADALIAEDLSVGGSLSIGGRTVSYGANDSGGTGYRLLRVTNA